MKRGSDLEDPVRAVAIPRPDARGIVTANMLNKSECGTHGGPAEYHCACVCACVRACVRVCVRACVRALVRACVRMRVRFCVCVCSKV